MLDLNFTFWDPRLDLLRNELMSSRTLYAFSKTSSGSQRSHWFLSSSFKHIRMPDKLKGIFGNSQHLVSLTLMQLFESCLIFIILFLLHDLWLEVLHYSRQENGAQERERTL